jgi:hypothetical protein
MSLTKTLGNGFFPPDVLIPRRKNDQLAASVATGGGEHKVKQDVATERFSKLEKEFSRGKTEIVSAVV